MTLRNLRNEWETQEDLLEIAQRTLLEEEQKARLHSSLAEIQEKCINVHASFLFQPAWKDVLNTLCYKLCSFPSTSSGGWMDFAAHLGLDKDLISSVRHNNINIQKDKAYIVLDEYAKGDGATIYKIFRELNNLKRYDIIDTLSPAIIDLCNAVNTNPESSFDGGYSSEGKPFPSFGEPLDVKKNSSRTILLPVKCKETIIRNSCKTIVTNETQSHSLNLFDGESQKSDETFSSQQTKEPEIKTKKVYSIVVLLTFAEDGETVARELAAALRSSYDKQGRSIGVVVLNENKYLIAEDPCIKITDCFNQVDFVIPIITKKYISHVFPSMGENAARLLVSASVQPDAYYAPLIFRLMASEYTRQLCINTRFRSVIPTDHKDILFADYSIMNIPFLSPWCLSADAIETPRKALLLRRKNRVLNKLTA